MCGIVGYTGPLNAQDVIMNGLRELEYRGYDSAGTALLTGDGIRIIKAVGRVAKLGEKIEEANLETRCAIGHTRWATHGKATEVNCHPHRHGKVTLIHNGIIENYQEILDEMAKEGRYPVSETDTEALAIFLDAHYNGNPMETLCNCLPGIEGSYAICVMFDDHPGEIYVSRLGSPMVYAHTAEGTFISSDIVGIYAYTQNYHIVPEGTVGKMSADSAELFTFRGEKVHPATETVSWTVESARKGGYEYYMLKEINEEYDAMQKTVHPRIIHGLPDFSVDGIDDHFFKNISKIVITACGTALHAGMVGSNLMRQLLRIDTQVEVASEFRYNDPILNPETLVIVISQSGETADTLAALRLANERGAKTLAIVNVKGSAIAREAQHVLYTHAGPEIAVASTKAYAVQIGVLYLVALKFGMTTYRIDEPTTSYQITKLLEAIDLIPVVLENDRYIEEVAKSLLDAEHLFFIGRGIDYALSLEGSLKLKEISYIHSEAYAAGELKHGTISLITDGVPVIAICSQDRLIPKMVSNIREVQSRGAEVIFITNEDYDGDEEISGYRINIPKTDAFYTPIPVCVILQLIAYYVSYHKGLDVDHPRNLAKSVTVE